MREIRQAGNDPSFLLKALSEAAGELRRAFYGLERRDLLVPGKGFDDCWCLLAIAVHMRDTERGHLAQFESMIGGREPDLDNVDIDAIPLADDYAHEDEDGVMDEFHHLRRESTYLLWDLAPKEWQRAGYHPYRGRITVLDAAREVYRHDLEHLWQVKRMVDDLSRSPRRKR